MNFNHLLLSTLTTGVLLSSTSIPASPLTEGDRYFSKSNSTQNFSYRQQISHIVIGAKIISQFSPRNSQGEQIELHQLASELGYDHFNWVNYVETDPHGISDRIGQPLVTPYNDPPYGGYSYDSADRFPFYWDVESCDLCRQRHYFQHPRNLKQFTLVFEDAPTDYRLQPGEAVEFVTSLVGVREVNPEDITASWEILHTFRWQLTNPSPYYSQVTLVDKDVDLAKLPTRLLEQMSLDGGVLSETSKVELSLGN